MAETKYTDLAAFKAAEVAAKIGNGRDLRGDSLSDIWGSFILTLPAVFKELITGSGAPSSSLGSTDAIYLDFSDTDSIQLYGPKPADDSWSGAGPFPLNNALPSSNKAANRILRLGSDGETAEWADPDGAGTTYQALPFAEEPGVTQRQYILLDADNNGIVDVDASTGPVVIVLPDFNSVHTNTNKNVGNRYGIRIFVRSIGLDSSNNNTPYTVTVQVSTGATLKNANGFSGTGFTYVSETQAHLTNTGFYSITSDESTQWTAFHLPVSPTDVLLKSTYDPTDSGVVSLAAKLATQQLLTLSTAENGESGTNIERVLWNYENRAVAYADLKRTDYDLRVSGMTSGDTAILVCKQDSVGARKLAQIRLTDSQGNLLANTTYLMQGTGIDFSDSADAYDIVTITRLDTASGVLVFVNIEDQIALAIS